MRNKTSSLAVLATVTLLQSLLAVSASAGPTNAVGWLDRMKHAVENLNYSGTLVYLRPGKSETFQVYHRVENGEITERLVSLDGAGAEIIRSSDKLMCVFPHTSTVVVGATSPSDPLTNPLPLRLPEFSQAQLQQYSVDMVREDRIAGRAAIVLAIQPRDGFRYGYRLWLDQATAMPLKSQLLANDSDMPVEEVFFTALDMVDMLSPDAVKPSIDTDTFEWVRQTAADESPTPALNGWNARSLPEGFRLITESIERSSPDGPPRLHLVYSDGLASVSVFVDAGVAAAEQVEGQSLAGAANAYSLVREGLLVTAMGAVPALTVEYVARAMEPAAAAQ